MYRVYLQEPIHPAAEAYLRAHVQLLTREADLPLADAVLTRNLRIDAAFLEQAKNLKVIAIHGTGRDGVDEEAAQARGVEVFSTPGRNAQAVAELIAAMALMLSRRLPQAAACLGESAPAALLGQELRGKCAGFLGTGQIARRAAEIFCGGFGMRTIGYSPSYTRKKAAQCRIGFAPGVEAVLREADYVCMCLPLNGETRGMLGKQELGWMKRSAYLINCARGGLVDEQALAEALRRGRIAGAAADVFAEEPVSPENPLLQLPNFFATPHIGGNTEQALYAVGMAAAEGIVQRLTRREGGRN